MSTLTPTPRPDSSAARVRVGERAHEDLVTVALACVESGELACELGGDTKCEAIAMSSLAMKMPWAAAFAGGTQPSSIQSGVADG